MNARQRVAAILVFVLAHGAMGTNRAQEEKQRVPCSPVGNLIVETLPKEILVDETRGEFVIATGRWQSATQTGVTRIPAVNAVEVTCYKPQGICRESIGMLYTGLDEDIRREGYGNVLTMSTHDYSVREWSDRTIIAVEKPRAADIEIRISLEHKTAERTLRETGARGAAGPSPIPRRWILE